MDLSEYVSDYVQMYKDNGERLPTKQKLAKEISESLDATDYEITATPEQVLYYL